MQLTDHFFFFGLAAGATQAKKIKNVGNCFSLNVIFNNTLVPATVINCTFNMAFGTISIAKSSVIEKILHESNKCDIYKN